MNTRASTRLAWLAPGFFLASGAHAQQPSTVGDMLNSYLKMLESSCPARTEALEKAKAGGNIGEIVVTRTIHQTLCVCHPAKARSLLTTLPAERLSARVETTEGFYSVATPGIMEPCAGEQLRFMFEGPSCDGFHSTDIKPGTKQDAYCSCMKKEVTNWSDRDVTQMLQQVGTYNAKFRAAKLAKSARPERTPLVDRYIGSLGRCGGGAEFED